MEHENPRGRYFKVPVEADSVAGPTVIYDDGFAAINFVAEDAGWGRVTFEKLDSIRVCRGEHEPYEIESTEELRFLWVAVIENSPWLRERFAYEKKHYGNSYNFNGDVDEMIRDFSHYVFHFHDQFVEALCAGIWFETTDDCSGDRELSSNHLLLDLVPSTASDSFVAHGITCEVRKNPRPMNEILADAALCSQKLLQFGARLGGSFSPAWTLAIRARDGKVKSYLNGPLGNTRVTYERIAGLSEVRPYVEEWLQQVRERRRELGLQN